MMRKMPWTQLMMMLLTRVCESNHLPTYYPCFDFIIASFLLVSGIDLSFWTPKNKHIQLSYWENFLATYK